MFTFLLLQNYKLAQVAMWLTRLYSSGQTLLLDLLRVERGERGSGSSQTTARCQTDRLHDRKPVGNKSVYYYTLIKRQKQTTSIIHPTDQGSNPVAYSSSEFLKLKTLLSNLPKLTAKCEAGGLYVQLKSHLYIGLKKKTFVDWVDE